MRDRSTTTSMTLTRLAVPFVLACLVLVAANNKGSHAEYVGGTISQIPAGCGGTVQAADEWYLVLFAKGARWRLPYDNMTLIEYGQKVYRRYIAAVLISPLFLLAK